jgi:hypothetical protein
VGLESVVAGAVSDCSGISLAGSFAIASGKIEEKKIQVKEIAVA